MGACVVATADWPTRGGNWARTGYNVGETGSPPLTRAWGITTAQTLRPVAIAGGTVFVTSNGNLGGNGPNVIQAFDLATGALDWSYDFGDAEAVGEPSVDGGVVYVGVNHGIMFGTTAEYAFDAATGRIVWRTAFSSQWETFWAPLVIGGTVYADGGEYGGLLAWNASSGTQVFFDSMLEQYDEWSPTWDGTSVLTFMAGHLRSHDPASGAVTRTTTVPWNWVGWSMRTVPIVDAGRTYVIAPPSLIAVETPTGAMLWSISHNFDGVPATADGHVYAVSAGALESRAGTSGAIEWTFVGDGALVSPAVLTPTHAYVSSDANTYALDRATGTMVWTAGLGGRLSIGEGHLAVAGATGTLTVYALTP
jgi:outer membrane protein assembly factor BamB